MGETLRSQRFIVFPGHRQWAKRGSESHQGADLNGDGDAADMVVQIVSVP
jgi:hypothetical protein